MNDPIKEFVKLNRAGFDDLRPSPDVFSKIALEAGFGDHKASRHQIYRWLTYIVAASLMIGIFTYFFKQQEKMGRSLTASDTGTFLSHKKKDSIPGKFMSVPQLAIKNTVSSAKPISLRRRNKTVHSYHDVKDTDSIMSLLFDKLSASTRILALQKAGKLPNLEPLLVKSIVQCTTEDPNSNVRLAALDVLVSRLPESRVIEILERVFIEQDDPFVQTELIGLMTNLDTNKLGPGIKNKLLGITENPHASDFVKDNAYTLLLKH